MLHTIDRLVDTLRDNRIRFLARPPDSSEPPVEIDTTQFTRGLFRMADNIYLFKMEEFQFCMHENMMDLDGLIFYKDTAVLRFKDKYLLGHTQHTEIPRNARLVGIEVLTGGRLDVSIQAETGRFTVRVAADEWHLLG